MMNEVLAFEEKNKKRGMRISLTIHALLLLLAWLYYFQDDPAQSIDTQYAVEVEFIELAESSLSKFTKDDEGSKRPKEEVRKIETTPVQKEVEVKVKTEPIDLPTTEPQIEPQPTEPVVTEVMEEESEIEAIEEELEMEDAEFEEIPEDPVPDPVVEASEEAGEDDPSEEAVIPSSGEVSENEDGGNPSVLDGDEGGTGKGSKGDGDGRTSGDDGDEGRGDTGSGTGMYDGSGDGIFGRKVIVRNQKEIMRHMRRSGRITFKVCINRMGLVRYAEILWDETTITNRSELRKMLEAAKGYKFEPDLSAPNEQCGKLTFDIDMSDINKIHGGG